MQNYVDIIKAWRNYNISYFVNLVEMQQFQYVKVKL